MPSSLVDADSLLAVDVGTVTTRAILFDVVEGRYRFIASGQAPSTAAAPFKDVSEGVRWAIENLQEITGRTFLSSDHKLLHPMQEGVGVDSFVSTVSAGPALRAAVVGLLGDVSLDSVLRLARSTYARVVETIGLNDRRKPEEQIDSLIRLRPDIILISGGTESGATRSVQKLIETIGLTCHLMPAEKRPAILYAGNQKLAAEVSLSLQTLTPMLQISPNIRPTLEHEDLQPAQQILDQLYNRIRSNQLAGVSELNDWSSGAQFSTAFAEGRIVRFLSDVYSSRKGILGVDLGASAVTVIGGFGGRLTLNVYPQLGLGENLAGLLKHTSVDDIVRWLALDIPADAVQEYLHQKAIYPSSIPATVEDLAIEHAVARQVLYLAVNAAGKDFPRGVQRPSLGLMPYFEPLIAAGSTIVRAPTLGQSLLILLDAIQPVGITTIILDQNYLLPALGAAASRNQLLPIQVLESGAFLGLATVVAPVASARPGTPILRARLIYRDGNEMNAEIKQGALEILPLPEGHVGRLYLQPTHQADIGFGPGRGGEVPVNGTIIGIVIDARGRPLRLPADPDRRRELLKKWLWIFGG